jgi:hypothetical protein
MRRSQRKTLAARTQQVLRGRTAPLGVIIVMMALSWCDPALAAGPRVFLLRGWFGIFSTGLDSVADQLKAFGIEAEVAGHLNWSNVKTERASPGGRQ